MLCDQYIVNKMIPINNLALLDGIKLNILLQFQLTDEVVGNRDDILYIERLRHANKGLTTVLLSNDGGHNTYHATLWKYIESLTEKI